MGVEIGGQVERIDGRELSYHEFVEKFLQKNQPILITGLMDGWRASKEWVTEDGAPNLSFFSNNFGKSKVQVADCSTREFTDQKRLEMSVSEFINYWLLQSSAKRSADSSHDDEGPRSLLYLKDWHFVKEYPEYVAYDTPLFFLDDWLNLYLDSYPMHADGNMHGNRNEINCSDYRFVYMGPKGTWTPLHADVFRSYSWSANVCGKKKWNLLPPSQSHLLFDRNLKHSAYDIFDEVSEAQFPGIKKAVWLECTQEQNEIIFVPSGWYHQVLNMEDTVSINHNWFSGHNLSWVWKLLLKDYKEAKEYIDDIREICDDFEGLCQRNLAANTGMNFSDFFIFITRFTFAHLFLLCHHVKKDKHSLSIAPQKAHHLTSNLLSILKVSLNMKSVDAFPAENCSLVSDVRKILEEPEFFDLCMALKRAYELIDVQWRQVSVPSSQMIHSTTDFCEDLVQAIGLEVANPRDLVRIINHALSNLSWMDSCWIPESDTLECMNVL